MSAPTPAPALAQAQAQAPAPTLAPCVAYITPRELAMRLTRVRAQQGKAPPAPAPTPPPLPTAHDTPWPPALPCVHAGACCAVPWAAERVDAPLLLDVRPSHIFQACTDPASQAPPTGPLSDAINVQVPTLLLRRAQRAVLADAHAPVALSLAPYVSTERGRALLEHAIAHQRTRTTEPALLDALWCVDVVVLYEDEASAASAHLLLQVLAAQRAHAARLVPHAPPRRGLYAVAGGMRAVRHTPCAAAWCADAAPAPDAAPRGGTPLSLRARRALPRLIVDGEAPASAPPTSRDTTPHALPLRVAPALARGAWDVPPSAREWRDAVPFDVSTIVPHALYLGPDIQRPEDVARLESLGIAAILNTAAELPDGGAPALRLRDKFAEYMYLPMDDHVEAGDVPASLHAACRFLDRMHAQGLATYVHCRAGKSRSVMVVMAYLMHQRRWRLQEAYGHVAACRPHASPNIGFMAELLHFERAVHHEPPPAVPPATPLPAMPPRPVRRASSPPPWTTR